MSIYKIRTEFGKHIKWGLYIVAAIFVVGAAFQFGPMGASRNRNKGNEKVIARVEGQEITRAQFNTLEAKNEQMMKQFGGGSPLSPLDYADMRTSLIQQLVQNKLVVKAAKAEGIDLSDRKVDQAYDKEVVKTMNFFRKSALGLNDKEAKKREKIDPRKDKEYKKVLGMLATPRSIADEEARAEAMISKDDILVQLASDQLKSLFESRIKKVTASDIKDSYDVYTVRQILIAKDKFPEEQAESQAKKIAAEAKKGDIVELAKKYSISPSTGDPQELTFEALNGGFPAEIKDAIYKLKPGEVSPAIKSDMGYFIVKLDKKENKMPAELDRKAKEERRKQIEDTRMREQWMAFSKKVDVANADVKILDPELDAYWTITKSYQAFGDQKKQDKLQKEAISLLNKALKTNSRNTVAMAKLGQLYQQTGDNKNAEKFYLKVLEGEKVEDSRLRMMLGDVYAAQSKKDEALAQYKVASDMAQLDTRIHSQLIGKYKQLGADDLVTYEEGKIKEIEANQKAWAEMQGQAQGKAPADKKAPADEKAPAEKK